MLRSTTGTKICSQTRRFPSVRWLGRMCSCRGAESNIASCSPLNQVQRDLQSSHCRPEVNPASVEKGETIRLDDHVNGERDVLADGAPDVLHLNLSSSLELDERRDR